LAQNVLRVLREPQLALRLSSNALEDLRRYKWDTVRKKWLNVYRALMAAPADVVATR
jgi:glycosyltransferase involved in cell wall biosynthesis